MKPRTSIRGDGGVSAISPSRHLVDWALDGMGLPPCFPLELNLRWVGPRHGVFVEPFAYVSPTHGRFEIEAGFDTDFASIPRGLWNILPPDGPYAPAAFIHDWLYWYQTTSREVADAILLEGMEQLGIGWLTRRTIHSAVRLGGAGPWEDNRRKRLGLPEPTPKVTRRLFRNRK